MATPRDYYYPNEQVFYEYGIYTLKDVQGERGIVRYVNDMLVYPGGDKRHFTYGFTPDEARETALELNKELLTKKLGENFMDLYRHNILRVALISATPC